MATLAQLRTRIRQRTDNEHTGGFVSDDELNGLINVKNREMYELLVIHGLQRAELKYDYTITTAAESYALPEDFFAVLGVYRQDAASQPRLYMTRHDHRVFPDTTAPAPAETYRIVGSAIEFNPVPNTGTYTLRYVPVCEDLEDDDDEVDGVLGWDEYIVVACAIDVLAKEEADPQGIARLENQLYQLKERLKLAAQSAELSENPCIANVRQSALDENCYRVGDFRTRGLRGWPF